jgi:hypothetical protein
MARERAHQIFARLSENLTRTTGRCEGGILCPLCLRKYPESAIDQEDHELTEEHIIPESLGGTLSTLSCKPCNNTHGTKLDSHLVQMVRAQASLSGSGRFPLKGRVSIAGAELPAQFSPGERTLRVRRCNPADVAEVNRRFREGNVNAVDLNFSLGYVPGRAYLACFGSRTLVCSTSWAIPMCFRPPWKR